MQCIYALRQQTGKIRSFVSSLSEVPFSFHMQELFDGK